MYQDQITLKRLSCAPQTLCEYLTWERLPDVWEIKTHGYYTSLDQLYFMLRKMLVFFGNGSIHVHNSYHPYFDPDEKLCENYAKSFTNIFYALNLLQMIECGGE